jgi:hypothetical protein
MLKFLHDQALWETLRHLARNCKQRRYIAVAYLGEGASDFLPLRRGDLLVCALTIANSKNGSVCPAEIAKLKKKGISVFWYPSLHAKVFLFGRKVIVGSSNLSISSQHGLDEAALLTTESGIVRQVRNWFELRILRPVTPEWLKTCSKVYRRPKPRGVRKRGAKTERNERTGSRIWLLGTEPTEYPEKEKGLYESGLVVARRRIREREHYFVETIRMAGISRFQKLAGQDDAIVEVWDDGENHPRVYPYSTMTNTKQIRRKSKNVATYVYLERAKRPKTIPWAKFKTACRKFGLRLGHSVGIREIRNPLHAAHVLSLVRTSAPSSSRKKSK